MLINITFKLFNTYYSLTNQKIVLFDRNPYGKPNITCKVIKQKLYLYKGKCIEENEIYHLDRLYKIQLINFYKKLINKLKILKLRRNKNFVFLKDI